MFSHQERSAAAIIGHIASLQSRGEGVFPDGIFPAYRANKTWGYHRPATNLFFTALTLFTLMGKEDRLPPEARAAVDAISQRAVRAYPLFQNKDGLQTYNFYQTPRGAEKKSGHFPHGYLLNRLEHFRLPDDVDDTAMVYLTTEPTPAELAWLKQKLTLHANGATRQIRNTFPDYGQLRAYSTWFGKNMYVEFDACVLSNLLYCIFRYGLPLNVHDHDSLAFLRSVVETGRYRTHPFRCAHSYPHTVLILYHLARLIGAFSPEALEPIRPILIRDAGALLATALPAMDRLLISTALIRLGERPPRIDVNAIPETEIRNYSFFVAGMLTAYENPLLYRLAPSPFVRMNWTCEAHSWALVVEYLLEV